MRWTVPVPMPRDLATFKIPTPFASWFRTFRSVALSILGRPSFTPCAMARLRPALTRWRIIVRSNSDLDYIPAPPLGDLPKLADLIFQRLCVRADSHVQRRTLV